MHRILTAVLLLAALALPVRAQVDAHMLRHPDVSDTHITFVYAGDVWIVPKTGGTAHRLSSPEGDESFPRFSPDGTRIAFSANYDGNTDVYVMPALGGQPVRLSHHPQGERVLDWFPDGEAVLFASSMQSGRQRFNQLYRQPAGGGMAEKLPLAIAEFGAISPDGGKVAFTPKDRSFRTWKRYRGGSAPDVYVFDLETYASENVTDHPANDAIPMWHGETLYFLSDRGPNQRHNIWKRTPDGQIQQVTDFADFDVHFPAVGRSDIVFEAGGDLYVMDLATEEARPVDVDVVTDLASIKPQVEDVGKMIQNAWPSPNAKRVVVEARGELFSVPAEHGPILNLTHSSGTAERYPAWSPDGEHVAFFSDASGEYELTLMPAGGGESTTLTSLGPGYRYQPYWSPDGDKLAFVDEAMRVQLYDVNEDETVQVDEGLWMYQGGLSNFRVSWSSDGRWMAYSRGLDNRNDAIFLYDTDTGERHQVTSGYYDDGSPVFDPDGQYLYALSGRSFDPAYSDLDNSFIYANTTNVVAIPLRDDVPSPLAPRNDAEDEDEGEDEDEENGEEENGNDGEDENGDEQTTPVDIDLDGFEQRLVVLPPDAGNYTDLYAAKGKVIYRRLGRTGADEDESPVIFYDLEEREETTILDDADGIRPAHESEKLLVYKDGQLALVDVKPGQQMETPLRTAEMTTTVDPRAEWQQIFRDAWRFERDFFYDPNMHGVDWQAVREQYEPLVEQAATRWDVNYVLGEMIAELNASHTYRGGGDLPSDEERGVGLLGVDWELNDGAYRIARIVRGAPWDNEVRSPFDQPGVDVDEGDYVLAVNGVPIDTDKDPYAAFQGLAGETVVLTVNDDEPALKGARDVVVETLPTETRLRHLEWIEQNRQRVEEATDGQVGYVYVRSTGVDGQTELVRQFRAQYDKPGLIVDERFNSGGQIPDRFIELLDRPPLAYWAVRHGATWQWPPVAHFGPKAMLINGWSGSGGDAFPDYFRKAGLGPLIGTRTWGGLIGITGAPPLVDGGVVTVPTFRMFDPNRAWFAEGHGVDPDIEVPEDPSELARGRDPQLERAIQELMQQLDDWQPLPPEPPGPEVRTAPPGR